MSYSQTNGGTRPLPHPTELSAPHWEGARERRLRVQRCTACGGYVFIPRRVCTHCMADALSWVDSPGLGKVYSYTIVYRAPDPAFEPPYCIAIIELDEGWQMVTNIVGVAMDRMAVGQRVRVDFLDVGPATLPVFRPVSEKA